MDPHLRHQRDASLAQLDGLTRRGRAIREARQVAAVRAWQQDCAALINQLSGGSKAHWLARAFSSAFLVRAADGGTVLEADAMEIVDRLLLVLAQGAASLAGVDEGTAAAPAPPRPRRFEFVRNAALRPVLEEAFADSRAALERGEPALSLILSCSVIDALLADALGPRPDLGDSFEARIDAAERARLVRGSCARLTPLARNYRALTDAEGELRPGAEVPERDARVAAQVLNVVIRDLDPGR
jgi:hypothetical protein